MKLLIACLLGFKYAWSGDDRYRNNRAVDHIKLETLIPVCPEQMGGLPTPRLPQEIRGGVQAMMSLITNAGLLIKTDKMLLRSLSRERKKP
jgi:uncharacterized protein YbbK (DUF523 family)